MKALCLNLALATLVLLNGGCENLPQTPASNSDQYMVIGTHTAFYRYGPAQALGADFVLKKGQRITLLKRDFGFCQIQTTDGQRGYVASDEIIPAPPQAPGDRHRENVSYTTPETELPHMPMINPRDFEVPDSLPEMPPEDNSPRFRY